MIYVEPGAYHAALSRWAMDHSEFSTRTKLIRSTRGPNRHERRAEVAMHRRSDLAEARKEAAVRRRRALQKCMRRDARRRRCLSR